MQPGTAQHSPPAVTSCTGGEHARMEAGCNPCVPMAAGQGGMEQHGRKNVH